MTEREKRRQVSSTTPATKNWGGPGSGEGPVPAL